MAEIRQLDAGASSALREWIALDADAHPERNTRWVPVCAALDRAGIFRPITIEARSNGRARCRECGHVIPEGATAIRFEWDGGRGYGRPMGSYVHAKEEQCRPATG